MNIRNARTIRLLSDKVLLISPLSSSQKFFDKEGREIKDLLSEGRFEYEEFVSWSKNQIKECKFDFIVEDRQLIFDKYKEISKKIFNHVYQDWGTKDVESIEKFFKEYFDHSLDLVMITVKPESINNKDIYRFHLRKKKNSLLEDKEILERIRPAVDFLFL